MNGNQRSAQPDRQSGRRMVWAAGLIVATGAGIATAHGLYQVAAAARVPVVIAWLYPLITDGLALVAYAATARLHHGGRRYAATIVILAAGLSGLAQATYLAGGLTPTGHTPAAATAPAALRFGVGAWPAIAAALTAHLLHLIGTDTASIVTTSPAEASDLDGRPHSATVADRSASNPPSNSTASNAASNPLGQPRPTTERPAPPVQPDTAAGSDARRPLTLAEPATPGRDRPGMAGSARERALAAARAHREARGTLPTATDLAALAGTSRGTAGTVLKDLREDRPALHVVNDRPENRTEQ
jgi:hypothetical protein